MYSNMAPLIGLGDSIIPKIGSVNENNAKNKVSMANA